MNNSVVIGFTGSREGMTMEQKKTMESILSKLSIQEARHGDCVGADAQFHEYCISHDIPVIIHPPQNVVRRAYCSNYKSILPPKDYIPRDKDIVKFSDVIIATPKTKKKIPKSGTWFTFQYAKRMKKKYFLINPDGLVADYLL
jgi:hypothetical protein